MVAHAHAHCPPSVLRAVSVSVALLVLCCTEGATTGARLAPLAGPDAPTVTMATTPAIQVFASPTGRDDGPGTQADPLRTLLAARNRVRHLRATAQRDGTAPWSRGSSSQARARVVLLAGSGGAHSRFALTATLDLTGPSDSNTPDLAVPSDSNTEWVGVADTATGPVN